MIPRGAHALIEMRKQGKKPESDVWVLFGDFPDPDWWKYEETRFKPEIVIRESDPIKRIDARALYGLVVAFFFREWGKMPSEVYETLQSVCSEIIVMSPSFEKDIGWWWHKKYGQISFDDRMWITEYEEARIEAMGSASCKDPSIHKRAIERELRALEAAPWLRF